ncbi:MAG: hypothetical protein U0271_01010 [Polyangiaceae bacterium]
MSFPLKRRPRHLFLLPGGLDAGSARADADADWRSFCERIGWQGDPIGGRSPESDSTPLSSNDSPAPVDSDLVDRIFGAPGGAIVPTVESQPSVPPPSARRRTPRRSSFLGQALAPVLLVAAGAAAGVGWTAWVQHRLDRPAPSVSREPAADFGAHTTPAPSSLEQAPRTTSVPSSQPSDEPAPSAVPPRSRIKPPGGGRIARHVQVAVATRPTHDNTAHDNTAHDNTTRATWSAHDVDAHDLARDVDALDSLSMGELRHFSDSRSGSRDDARYSEVVPRAVARASNPNVPELDLTSARGAVRTSAVAMKGSTRGDAPAFNGSVRPVSWSVDAGDRWFGAQLEPHDAGAGYLPSVGVVGQIDLAKVDIR